MRILGSGRKWGAAVVGLAVALAMTTAASADMGLATASVTQLSVGTPGTAPDCTQIVGAPVPGFSQIGEVFAGLFTDVSGRSRESKLLSKSAVRVVQDAAICLVSVPDPAGYVEFYGVVGGSATIARNDESGKNTLTAVYGSPVSGKVNVVTGEIAVQWLPGGAYTIAGVTGKFARAFEVGETGTATATAYSPALGVPEVGTFVISFNFEGTDKKGLVDDDRDERGDGDRDRGNDRKTRGDDR